MLKLLANNMAFVVVSKSYKDIPGNQCIMHPCISIRVVESVLRVQKVPLRNLFGLATQLFSMATILISSSTACSVRDSVATWYLPLLV